MKTIFAKMGILMTLIFSFLFTAFSPNTAKALEDGENYQTEIVLTSFNKTNDETIQFTTANKYDVIALTYVYTYYSENNVLVENLVQRSKDFTKVDDYTYKFAVSPDWQGVKLYKIQYYFNSDAWADKFTNGFREWGNMDSKYKMNYVEISAVELKKEIVSGSDWDNNAIYHNKLYFKFADLNPDEVTKVVADFETHVNHKVLWGIKWSDNYKNYENYEINSEITPTTSQKLKDWWGGSYKKYEIFKSDDSNYDWYVYLIDTAITSTHVFGSLLNMDYQETVIENASIIKISYISEGHYYNDVPVLSPDSGWIHFEQTVGPNANSELPWWIWLIIVGVGLMIIGILALICKPIAKGIAIIFKGIWYLLVAIYYILKWTIFLPITLIVRHVKKKEDDDLW